jgi:hypothetical protein
MAQKIALGMTEGGIVEEGAGYVKFETGLMFCWGIDNVVHSVVDSTGPLWYRYTSPISFPQTFLNPPSVTCGFDNIASSDQAFMISPRSATTTAFNSVIHSTFSAGARTFPITWVAIGRWK